MKQIDSKKDCFFTEIGITLRRNGFGAPPTDGRFCLRRNIRPRRQRARPAPYLRCDGCPYPAHGFICWRGDGGCIRSITEKMKKRQEEK